jgi:hypothetical protein
MTLNVLLLPPVLRLEPRRKVLTLLQLGPRAAMVVEVLVCPAIAHDARTVP